MDTITVDPRDYCACCGAGPGIPCDEICEEIRRGIAAMRDDDLDCENLSKYASQALAEQNDTRAIQDPNG